MGFSHHSSSSVHHTCPAVPSGPQYGTKTSFDHLFTYELRADSARQASHMLQVLSTSTL